MSLPLLWGTEKFRKSVINKLNSELEHFPLMAKNAGQSVEKAIFDKVQSKNHYLGYSAKIILSVRNMVYIDDDWLENCVKTILSSPPPKLRKVLRPAELAKYNMEMMKLRTQLQVGEILKNKASEQ